MNRIGSETVVSRASSLWRWAGAVVAGAAIGLGAAPALAADVNTLDLMITQSPSPAVYGSSATYTLKLTNTSNKTVNNAGITVTAPAGSMFVAPGPSCALSTGLPCATPSGSAASFAASGYQLPAKQSLTITVGYYMPAAASPPASFVLNATGTSSNNAGGPNPSAYTTVTTAYTTIFAPPPPTYPTIDLVIEHDSGNTVLWSTVPCNVSNTEDCGASYYGQYKVTVVNLGADPIPASKPFEVEVSSVSGAFAGAFGCAAPCSAGSSSNKFVITGLSGNGSTSFTIFFKTPQKPNNLDVAAKATIGPLMTPVEASYVLDTAALTTVITADAAIQTYSSLVPTTGGSAKAKNTLDSSGKGPFSTRVDLPTYNVAGTPINIVMDVKPGSTACSSSSPKCLDTKLDVQSNGVAVTYEPLNGTNFMVITMVRDWTTLDRKPSSVFNATVWYTDDAGNRTNVKDCGSVNLATADRCVYQRIDMTTSAKGVITGGYLKFIIWARHNGVMSW